MSVVEISKPIVIRGRGIVPGVAEAQALVTRETISGWGGVNPMKGEIIETRHELVGQSFAGKVLLFRGAKGSSGWSAIFHFSRLAGVAPAAMLFVDMTAKVALGAVVTHAPTVTDFDIDPLSVIETGDRVRVDGGEGLVEIWKTQTSENGASKIWEVNMTTDMQTAAPEEESDFSPRKIKIMIAATIGILFGSSILPFTAIMLLTLPMTEEFGWTRTQFSGGLTAMMLVGGTSAPFLGRLVDKIGARKMIIFGTAVVGLITMALSRQDGSLWQFYFGFAVLGFAGTTAIGYSKIIGALFNKHRGKALAIFGVESSIAGVFAPKLIQFLIDGYGWRGMFVGLGIIILSVIPVLLIWLREPEAPKAPEVAAGAPPPESPGLTPKEAMKTRDFWFILMASVIAMAPAMGLQPHLIPFIVSRGVSVDTAVWMLSISQLAMAAGTVAGGFLMDKMETAKIAAPFSAMTAVGLFLYLFLSGGAAGFSFLLMATILIGFSGGAKRPMGTVFQLRFFGLKSFGTLVGIQTPFQTFCMGVAPLLVGMYYDKHGDYELVFVIMSVLMAITFFLYWFLGPYRYDKSLLPVGGGKGPVESQTPIGAMQGASAAMKQEGH